MRSPVSSLSSAPERRAVGRAVPGDRHRAARARQRRAGVVAGPAPQAGRVRPRHDHRVDADRAHADAPERLAVVGAAVERARRVGELAIERAEVREHLAVRSGGLGALELGQVVVEPPLLELRVQRRHRLLPHERDDRVGEQQRADDQQDAGKRLQDAPHGAHYSLEGGFGPARVSPGRRSRSARGCGSGRARRSARSGGGCARRRRRRRGSRPAATGTARRAA